MATGDLKGCMLLRGAKLSNTKTSRKGKFAFRLEGNGSSASHRAGRKWHKWTVAAAAKAQKARRPRPRRAHASAPPAAPVQWSSNSYLTPHPNPHPNPHPHPNPKPSRISGAQVHTERPHARRDARVVHELLL